MKSKFLLLDSQLLLLFMWGSLSWVFIEIAGVLVYGFLAWLGVRFTKYWLAFGWTAHLVWDWVLHFRGAGSAVAPEWYVFLCISFDLFIAGYIIVGLTSRIKTRAA
ncbi:MAG: hypothetical protein R3211_03335 [Balneolaceae bacterium]|nr:hypothetical protein [Balneolaceae bacterium]